MKTPQQIMEKWKRNLSAAAPSFIAGVQSVTEAPGQAAAKAKDRWAAAVQEAIANNSFATASAAVPLQSWQESAIAGAKNLVAGAAKGASKVESFQTQFQPFVQSVRSAVRSMPNTTPEERNQRMIENANRLRTFKKRPG